MKKKKTKTRALVTTGTTVERERPYKKHPNENHPACGLLTHAYRDQSGNPEEPAGVCGECGFDEEFHSLDVDDYTGPGRDGDWLRREKALRSEEEFSDRE